MFDDQARQRFRAVCREPPLHRAIDRADRRRTGDEITAIRFAAHAAVRGRDGRVSREFADDFLEQVFQRDQAEHVAVLIDHESKAPPVALEVQQLRVQRGALRHVVCVALRRDFAHCLAGQPAAREFVRDALHVQHADQLVEFAFVNGQARVLCFAQALEDRAPVVVQIDADDIAARNHDVIDRDALEIEDAHQHLLVAARDHRTRFSNDRAQFLAGQGCLLRNLVAADADQHQHAVGHAIDQPDGGIQQQIQGTIDVDRAQRHALRMQRTIGLRPDLAEDQHHESQHAGTHRDPFLAPGVEHQQRDERGREVVGEIVAEQDQADQAIRPLQQALGQHGATMSLTSQRAQPIAIDAHQRRFGSREERRQREAQREQA